MNTRPLLPPLDVAVQLAPGSLAHAVNHEVDARNLFLSMRIAAAMRSAPPHKL